MKAIPLLALAACAPDGTEPELPPAPPPEEVTWHPCALVPGDNDSLAECAEVALPLDHDDPSRGTLDVFVKRLPARGEERGQYWVLHGGPGASAVDDLWGLAAGLDADHDDLGFYAVDHRGIGGSGHLGCSAEDATSPSGSFVTDAEYPDCIDELVDEWGDDLALISTTNSARDIGTLIGMWADDDTEVFVYGGSYGTYLAQRYLHLFPDQPTGVVLDGIAPHDRAFFVGYDARMDAVGQHLMDVCAADPGCASHFGGGHPWDAAQRGVASIDDGSCVVDGVDGATIRVVLGYLTIYAPLNAYVPALAARLDRCDLDDTDAIGTIAVSLFGAVEPRDGNTGEGRSNLLGKHIGLSELWDTDLGPSLTEAFERFETYTMSLAVEVDAAKLAPVWPTFDTDAFHGVLPDYAGPLLMLQGGLDSATPLEEASVLADHFTGPAQTFAAWPYAAHGVVSSSLLPDGQSCGYAVLSAFVSDPEADLDLSCIDASLPPDWDGDPLISEWLFGDADPWGD